MKTQWHAKINQVSAVDTVIRSMYAWPIFHSADNGLRPHPPYAG